MMYTGAKGGLESELAPPGEMNGPYLPMSGIKVHFKDSNTIFTLLNGPKG